MTKDDRLNNTLETVVNKGLAAAILLDLSTGFRIMSENKVPSEVIQRVLFSPQLRRDTDWRS